MQTQSHRAIQRTLMWAPFALALGACGSSSSGNGEPPPPPTTTTTDTAVANLNQQSSAGLAEALGTLEAAVAAGTAGDADRTLLGAVRLAAFLDPAAPAPSAQGTGAGTEATLVALLAGFGIDLHGASIFDFINGTAPEPTTTFPLPDESPTLAEIQAFLREELRARVQASAADWEAVTAGFSRVFPDLFGHVVELDFGDARLLAAGARALEAKLSFQAAFDLQADIDVLANWESGARIAGGLTPFRLFNGDSPANVVQGQLSDSGRMGFLNEAATTLSTNTFLPSAAADSLLNETRLALAAAIRNFREGVLYVEDADSSDDLLFVNEESRCPVALADPWIEDVLAALENGDAVIAPFMASDSTTADCEVDLPGFTLDRDLVFSPLTYDGRLFLPDYTTTGMTVADETSFPHAVNDPLLTMLATDLTGAPLDGFDWLRAWNELNRAWDELFAGFPLEKSY